MKRCIYLLLLTFALIAHSGADTPSEIAKALKGTWKLVSLNNGNSGAIIFDDQLRYEETRWFPAGTAKLRDGMLVIDKEVLIDVSNGVRDDLRGSWRGLPRQMTRIAPTAKAPKTPETPASNSGLSRSDRIRMLYDLRDEKLISSIRRGEELSDRELRQLHAQAMQQKRLRGIEQAIRSIPNAP